MNTLPTITSYEIKTSRTEQKVPVVNGVHLHSIYNPFKEAESFINSHLEILKNKNEVLILGLGFAYHVNYVIEKLTEFHGDNFRIVVIEPNNQVYQDCVNLDLLNKKNILVYSGHSSNEIFSDLDLIHFLLSKPAMLAHPPSFNLYQEYFKEILTFEAPVKNIEVLDFIKSSTIKKYLTQFEPEESTENSLFQKLPQKTKFDKMDFLAMALVEMTKGSIELSNGDKK